jgi:hypothetical protein
MNSGEKRRRDSFQLVQQGSIIIHPHSSFLGVWFDDNNSLSVTNMIQSARPACSAMTIWWLRESISLFDRQHRQQPASIVRTEEGLERTRLVRTLNMALNASWTGGRGRRPPMLMYCCVHSYDPTNAHFHGIITQRRKILGVTSLCAVTHLIALISSPCC